MLKDELLKLTVIQNQLEKILITLKRTNRQIVLFGAGISGQVICRYLLDNHITPVAFVDSNKNKWGKTIYNIEIKNKCEIGTTYKNSDIIISCDAYREIREELKEKDIDVENHVFFIDPRWIKNPDGEANYIIKNIEDFQTAYELLEDDKSKKIFKNLLKYKMTYDLSHIEKICDKNMYFPQDLFCFEGNEVFIDAGSYIGDTLQEYMDICNGKYKKILCFEPNAANAEALIENIRINGYKNIKVFRKGLSNRKTIEYFDDSSDVAARISSVGRQKIECVKLDDILENEKLPVHFIKMDIEGSEAYALEGSRKSIEKWKPILAICVYHKPDDFFTIPLLIKNIYSGYKLYFRQYELSAEETVCYAIP